MSHVQPAGEESEVPGLTLEHLQPFWAQFRRMRDPLGREELLIAYRHIVDDVLAMLVPDGLAGVELAALERRAMRSLGEAIERYPDDGDLERFSAYAHQRVELAVTDGLQRLDWLPRTIFRREPGEQFATSWPNRSDGGIEQMLPGAESWGMRPQRSLDHAGQSRSLHPAGSRAAQAEDERAPFRALARTVGIDRDSIGDHADEDPAEQVRRALRRMPEQQRTVLTLQFLAGLSLDRVGALLGTSLIAARRASEQALAALRSAVEEDAGPLAAQAG